ncbi:tyrosine--tRNA ligase, mitochondrial [Anoplophora glabripennis]|uniref:tyrosine--tRNA ligase, mitochondrial n=1 Tax=Anoplophora glabripennis TaxID=217634 RepID=UPI000873ABD4|nr:tyrosine--tRNA ligase, mitochondrial [Anoplophora glabripennis]
MNNILKCRQTVLYFQRLYSNRNILKLRERGMFHDIFPDNAANSVTDILNAATRTVYAGFDPTADSLHVGNLLVLNNLLHWQRSGHQCIALIGGATAKIGDPSGKNTEREVLSKSFIDDNVRGICENIRTVFSNHKKYIWNDEDPLLLPIVVNNEEWYSNISAVELIGGAGRHMRMGTLLSRTSVQSRLNSSVGMSFTEFSYQLFQAYDWLHLFKQYKCMFQIGGNDQMGNIVSGHELISKACKKPVYGLTVPLVTTEIGDKFGKTAGNAVWLAPEKTSTFTFYQFWMRQPDSEVEKFLKLFTFDKIGSISDLMRRHREKPELRLPQKRLAEQVTLLVHGGEGLKKAQEATLALYEGSVTALGQMNTEDIAQLFSGATIVNVMPEAGQDVLELAMKAGCFPSKDDAIRIISAGGFYINQQKVNNPSEVLNLGVHRLRNNVTLLRVGKRNYYIVKWLK